VADRTITTDLIGHDVSLSKSLDGAGNSADKNAKKLAKLAKDQEKLDKAAATAAKAKQKEVEKFGKSIEKFGKQTSTAALQTLKWTGIVAGGAVGIVQSAGAVHALGVELISLSGTVGVLPGIFSAAAVGMVTVKLATMGFGAAIKNANPKKLSAELKALSPNARATALAISAIKPQLHALQQGVQNQFFAGMAKDIKPLAHDYLPLLRQNLGLIGGSLGGVIKGFAGFLKTPTAVRLVTSTLVDVSLAFRYLRIAMAPVGPAIVRIVAVSASFLPRLAAGLGVVTAHFGAFITRVSASGQLSDWIQRGLTAVVALGHGFEAVGHLVATFITGLSGSSGGISGFFAQIKAGSNAVTAVLPHVLAAVVALAPAFVNLVQASGGSFASTLKLGADAAIALAPSLNAVTHALIPIAPILGKVVPLVFLGAKALQGWTILTKVIEGVVLLTKAMFGLDVALDANVIGLVVIALAALSVGLVIAYKRSQTFRNVVGFVFKVVGNLALNMASIVLIATEGILTGLSKIPGPWQRTMRNAAKDVAGVRVGVDQLRASLNAVHSKAITLTVTTISKRAQQVAGGLPGHRALGGRVDAERPYIVGEKRPELFVPDQNGTILPRVPSAGTAGRSSGGGDVYITITGGTIIGNSAEFRRSVVDALNQGQRRGAKVST
jgi:hypothetical protein